MLTDTQIENNFNEFIELITNNIKRDGVDNLLKWLKAKDTKIAPASTKYHSSFKGGLVQHCLNVYKRLKSLIEAEYPENCPYSEETITLVSLLHDISKIEFYELKERNTKDENGTWIKVPFYQVREDENRFVFGNHTENSFYMVSKFMNLSYEESLAILHHEGAYKAGITAPDLTNVMVVFKKSKLALLLHSADLFATCMDETDE